MDNEDETIKEGSIEDGFCTLIANLAVQDEDTINLFVQAVHEWSKTHFVLCSPRLIELYGTDVLDINNMPPHGELPPFPPFKETPIYHICCCGKVSTYPILNTVHRCGCGAVWTGNILQVFGSTSCFDCYAHETRNLVNPKSYILNHCPHARRKMRKTKW
jgi:hypothetical protein